MYRNETKRYRPTKKMWACCSNTRYVVKRHVKIERDTTKQLVNVRDSYVRDAAAQKVRRIIAAVRLTKCLLFSAQAAARMTMRVN